MKLLYTNIIQCEKCLNLVSLRVASGAMCPQMWTDGAYRWLGTLYFPFDLAACPHCSHIFFIRDQAQIYQLTESDLSLRHSSDSNSSQNEWLPIRKLSFEDWMHVIKEDHHFQVKSQFILRRLAWQAGNDSRRHFIPLSKLSFREFKRIGVTQRSSQEIANMHWLIDSLGKEPIHRLFLSELRRELGLFRLAHKALQHEMPDALRLSQAFLLGLINARDSHVHSIPRFAYYPVNLYPIPSISDEFGI